MQKQLAMKLCIYVIQHQNISAYISTIMNMYAYISNLKNVEDYGKSNAVHV